MKLLDETGSFSYKFLRPQGTGENMAIPGQPMVKMTPVDADLFESVAYTIGNRRLYIQFRNAPMICYEGVPGFRYQGLLSAPRKDAYFKTYIKGHFLEKAPPAAGT
jgi:hypothetical protein